MKAARAATVILAGGLAAAIPGSAAPQGRERPAPRTAQTAPQPRAQNPNRQQEPRNPQGRARNQARGDEIFMRLLNMTPEEREKALRDLPPARREQIQKRIENFQQLKPEQQERRLSRVERLNALPLEDQARVRQSTKDLQGLQPDRRKAVNQELQRMSVMGESEKQFHMNTEEFRNRFSPAEQEMLGNLTKVY